MLLSRKKLSTLNLAGFHALGADVSLAYATILLDGDLLDVGAEHTVGNTMGVADVTTSDRCLSANFTNLGHT